MSKIYIKDRVYVPLDAVLDMETVRAAYTKRMYKDNACRQCEYRQDRHGHMCDPCQHYKGMIKLYSHKTIRGREYIGLPVGDKKRIEYHCGLSFDDYTIRDKRFFAPFDHKVKFDLTLRDYQEKLRVDFMKHKYGLIEAPPRTGKTALALAIGVELGQKMLLLADQTEFLDQFLWHIEGNEEEGIPKCTNLPELELKHKKKLYGYAKTDEDFENFQIFVSTYQQFASEQRGRDRFRKISKVIGTLMVDEVHSAAANVFSTVVNRFYTRYRFGVTGTVKRKDGRHYVIRKVFGPIVASTQVEAMVPKVVIRETGFKARTLPTQWVACNQRLAKSEPRNEMIARQIVRDVKKGHYVVVPLVFKKHMFELCNMVNIMYGEDIAKVFSGGGTTVAQKAIRRQILTDAKSGAVKVTIGTRRLLQRGLNVPKWSVIYECMPISNEPNLRQETARIRTPYEGKPQPIVRLYYDERMGISVGCAKNSVTHMKGFNYEFSTDAKTQEALEYFQQRQRRRGNDPQDDDADFTPTRLMKNKSQSPAKIDIANFMAKTRPKLK